MTKVAKGKRKRAFRPKTRSGCLTCKVRRVKCDEARPACLRCISTRRICDGYSPDISTPTVILSAPSLDIHSCVQSRRSFAFFTQHTCHQLAGFFGSSFWERLVLQAAHNEPAIRHSLVAIGSLHEQRTTQPNYPDTSFALEQYNLAIRCLLAPISQSYKPTIDVCLISSILFTSFENIQGNHAAAGIHIRSGSKLLQNTVYDRGTGTLQHDVLGSHSCVNSYVPLEVVATFFAGLNNNVATTIMRDYKLNTYQGCLSRLLEGDSSLSFVSVEEARNVFDYGYYLFSNNNAVEVSCYTEHSVNTSQGQTAYMITLISTFIHAFDNMIRTHGHSFTPKQKLAAAVLQLHILYAYITAHLEQLPPTSRPHSNTMLPQMTAMVNLGERIISSLSSGTILGSSTTSFCLDMGFVIPLYTVASQCQDPKLRRKAIALLRSTSRQEGIWNSILVAKAATRIMEIEEREGVQLTSFDDESNPSHITTFPAVLRLDASGCRLHYLLQQPGANNPVQVVEKVFD